MTFDDMERLLGRSVVQDMCNAVRKAFIASAGDGDEGSRALQDLLIGLLVSVTVTPTTHARSASVTDDCCRRLQEVSARARAAYAEGQAPPTEPLH